MQPNVAGGPLQSILAWYAFLPCPCKFSDQHGSIDCSLLNFCGRGLQVDAHSNLGNLLKAQGLIHHVRVLHSNVFL